MGPSPAISRPALLSHLRGPWGVFLSALLCTFVAYVAALAGNGPVHAIGIIAGLIAAGGALVWRLQSASTDYRTAFRECVKSACLVLLTGLLAEVDVHLLPGGQQTLVEDSFGVHDWGSARMFLRFLEVVAAVGVVLLLLPTGGRRLAISLLLLFHLGGILTALTAIDPPGAPAAWISRQLWNRVYRPYLSFMHLNAGYHFFSPEPAAPTLLWFHVRFEDGQARWQKIPVREEIPVPLHYQRLAALTDGAGKVDGDPTTGLDFDQKLERRKLAGTRNNIPLHPLIKPDHNQYREPTVYAKVLVSAYARFAARHLTHPTDPSIPVSSVRAYKVTHTIISAAMLAEGYSPVERTLFQPYYMGEFAPDGELLDREDPFLYWLIPIYPDYVRTYLESRGKRPIPGKHKIVDCLEVHKDLKSSRNPRRKLVP